MRFKIFDQCHYDLMFSIWFNEFGYGRNISVLL